MSPISEGRATGVDRSRQSVFLAARLPSFIRTPDTEARALPWIETFRIWRPFAEEARETGEAEDTGETLKIGTVRSIPYKFRHNVNTGSLTGLNQDFKFAKSVQSVADLLESLLL
jgi:hypothetical protein